MPDSRTGAVADLDVHLPAIAAGDQEAFAAWLAGGERRVRLSLRAFAARVDTEAVLQETLLRVWQVASRFKPDGRPDSLLRLAIRIGRNLAVSELRRARLAPVAIDELEQTATGGLDGAPPPDRAGDPFLRKAIVECHGRLPAKPALALGARLESSGSERDVMLAERVGMRPNTFLQNITRAAPDRRVPPTPRDRPGPGARVTSREALVEATVTAWRQRGVSGTIQPHPAWADLDDAGRSEAFTATLQARALEAALDAAGLTTTGHAVLARIRSAGVRRRRP